MLNPRALAGGTLDFKIVANQTKQSQEKFLQNLFIIE
jgi:hypothetical protein